jgi:hypothetical protein
MDEIRIRNIVRQEIASSNSSGRFGFNMTPQHSHTGLAGDGPQLNAGNLLPGLKTTGSVEFDSTKDYRFNVNFNPTLIVFYGNPYHTTSGTIDRHTFVYGQAALGSNLYFQPDTTASVTIGGKPGIVQSSTMFMALNSGTSSSFQTIANQTSLIHVQESGSVVVDAKVSSYGKNSFTVTVNTLASGWTVLGNYFVS